MPQVKTALDEKNERELAEFQKLTTYAERYAYYHSHPSLHGRFCKSNFSHEPEETTPAKPAKT